MPPAPTTSTDRSPSPPSSASARVSPACTSEPLTRSIEVSVCTRLATRSACWRTVFSGRPDVAVALGAGQRAAHLAEDLGLTDGHRVQARGHREDVGDAALLVVHEQVRLEVVAVDRAGLRQGRGDVGEGTVEGEALGIDLGAVARREHDGLGDVLGAQHGGLEGGARLGVEGDRLEQRQGRAVVRQAEDDEAHDDTTSGDGDLLPVEGEDLQLGREVDLAHDHTVGHREHGRGEVEHRAHAGGDEVVAGLLGALGAGVAMTPMARPSSATSAVEVGHRPDPLAGRPARRRRAGSPSSSAMTRKPRSAKPR